MPRLIAPGERQIGKACVVTSSPMSLPLRPRRPPSRNKQGSSPRPPYPVCRRQMSPRPAAPRWLPCPSKRLSLGRSMRPYRPRDQLSHLWPARPRSCHLNRPSPRWLLHPPPFPLVRGPRYRHRRIPSRHPPPLPRVGTPGWSPAAPGPAILRLSRLDPVPKHPVPPSGPVPRRPELRLDPIQKGSVLRLDRALRLPGQVQIRRERKLCPPHRRIHPLLLRFPR